MNLARCLHQALAIEPARTIEKYNWPWRAETRIMRSMERGNEMKDRTLAIVEALATIGTIVGLYFISEGNTIGFTISLFAGTLWLYVAHERNMLGLLITNAILILINLNGLGAI